MKNIKKYFVVLLLVLALVGCTSKPAENDGDSDIVTEVPEGTVVTLWHGMSGTQEEAITKITEDFMTDFPNIEVKLQNQGRYGDLQAKLNSTFISPKDLPTITQAYPNWLWHAVQDDLVVDLAPYMNNSELAIEDQDDIIPALMDAGKIEGVQYGLPFNKSTEVLYYNADMLAEHGVKVPTTMEELASSSKEIYEKTNGKVVGAGFDSLNNYYAIGMKNEGVDFNSDLDVTSQASKDVVNFYYDGIKEGYFRIAGQGEYLSDPFGAQTIAMNIGSMAGESHVVKAADGRFDYGVVNRPSEINLSQGTDIYMFDSATPEEKTAAFEYMKYLMSNDAQLYWALETGYMPVRTSVIESDAYVNASESKIPAIIGDATKSMFTIPVIENADPAYNSGRDMMERILSQDNADVDAELETFKTEFEAAWNQ